MAADPYDCGFVIVRDAKAHRRAMAISASYLPAAQGVDREPSAYVPEQSRWARGLGTWAMLRQYGRSGIAELVGRGCRIAHDMATALAAEPGIELVAEVVLNQFMAVRRYRLHRRGDLAGALGDAGVGIVGCDHRPRRRDLRRRGDLSMAHG